jgi:hypothetical protein
MRLRPRVDVNQPRIVRELRQFPGVSVASTAALGKGFPDIVVGYRRRTYLYEIKADAKKKLTDDEAKFAAAWTGHLKTVTTTEEILRDIGAMK